MAMRCTFQQSSCARSFLNDNKELCRPVFLDWLSLSAQGSFWLFADWICGRHNRLTCSQLGGDTCCQQAGMRLKLGAKIWSPENHIGNIMIHYTWGRNCCAVIHISGSSLVYVLFPNFEGHTSKELSFVTNFDSPYICISSDMITGRKWKMNVYYSLLYHFTRSVE